MSKWNTIFSSQKPPLFVFYDVLQFVLAVLYFRSMKNPLLISHLINILIYLNWKQTAFLEKFIVWGPPREHET